MCQVPAINNQNEIVLIKRNPRGQTHTHTHTHTQEGNVLFNDELNTFYLWLYGVRHMVKDHSDSERGNPLTPHGLLFSINRRGSFICTIPQTGYHVTPVMEHWLERDIAQWVHHEGLIRRPIAPWANALTTELHLAPHTHTHKDRQTTVQLPKIKKKKLQWHTIFSTVVMVSMAVTWLNEAKSLNRRAERGK